MSDSPRSPARSLLQRGVVRVWLFVVLLAGAAVVMAMGVSPLDPLLSGFHLRWWALAPGFYLAERAVLHLRFRKDAHSFSMSEIPLVLGLFFAAPLDLIIGQALGNVIVLALHRRQQPIKFAFNIVQFTVQACVAILVFRALVHRADPLGPMGWLAALVATLTALVVADLLINVVIRLSGGRLTRREVVEVVLLSALATLMNSSLALVAAILIDARPEAAWLSLVPPAVLFLAYRAYVTQREEGARLEALYEATRELHASPQIEQALLAAAERARHMFGAEYAELLLFPHSEDHAAYRTSYGPESRQRVMEPVTAAVAATMRGHILNAGRQGILRESFDHPLGDFTLPVRSAVVAPLMIRDGMVGAVLVANRLDDVSDFENDDARLLETIASQVAVSLENGRLEDSLAQLTALKEQLEGLVRSKDEFVASVSHELRTPLTAVVGLAEELRSNRGAFSEDEVKEFMDLIAEQSGELHNIVEDLLVAARADFGTLQLVSETFDLAAETKVVVARHTPVGSCVGPIEVVGSCSPVQGDRLRVRQILRNLLSNADRYGGDRVWVELANRGARVSVAVVDDGDGVSAQEAQAIFEPYRRADSAARQPLAVGLGLAVSRKLAEKMDGGLDYHRRAGCSVFELLLPLSTDSESPAPARQDLTTGPRSPFRL